jgi:hypothetical protein
MSRKATDINAMRCEMVGGHLNTYLVPANAKLYRQPLLAKARTWWSGNVQRRRPQCIACKAQFAEGAEVGFHLFSTASIMPTSASVSAFCCKCASDLSPDDIDRAATRVLRKLTGPGARFLDPPDAK